MSNQDEIRLLKKRELDLEEDVELENITKDFLLKGFLPSSGDTLTAIGRTKVKFSLKRQQLDLLYSAKQVKLQEVIDTIPIKISKKEIRKEITRVIKMTRFGQKEKELLRILSDLEPHNLKYLTSQVHTKDVKHLKRKLQSKIKQWGFSIKTDKAKGLNTNSFYQLQFSHSNKLT